MEGPSLNPREIYEDPLIRLSKLREALRACGVVPRPQIPEIIDKVREYLELENDTLEIDDDLDFGDPGDFDQFRSDDFVI